MPILKNIAAIAKGMSITFRAMLAPTVVEKYPDGPGPLKGAKFQERYRGVHGFEVAAFNASDLVYRKEQMLAPVPAHIGANAVFNQDEVAAGAPAVVAPGE